MATARPKKMGPYEVLDGIGQGAMGTIFLCYDPALDRRVVVKKLSEPLNKSIESLERFTREARIMANLLHPNFPQIYELWKERGSLHMAMEFIDGTDLRQMLNRSGPISWYAAAIVMWECARGLSKLHQNEIVHRDIKPSNIMLSWNGDVKLLDFGVAQIPGGKDLTQTGVMVGTMAYMSPEQCQAMELDFSSDHFSLAVTIQELMTQEHPFRGGESSETVRNILNAKARRIEPQGKKPPKAFEKILKRCLSKQPEKRFRSTEQLIKALDRLLQPGPRYHAQEIALVMNHYRMGQKALNQQNERLYRRSILLSILPWILLALIVLLGGMIYFYYLELPIIHPSNQGI